MLTKHEFKNIVEKVEEDTKEDEFLMSQEDFLTFTDKLYDALWEHLKDCD